MFKIICVMAVLFCQDGAFGYFRIDDAQRKIGRDLAAVGNDPITLVEAYAYDAQDPQLKYALGCLLSGTGGVEISEDRIATAEEQDIMLQGAAVAFYGMAEEDILLCLNGVAGGDFTPKPATGTNVNTHRAFMRAFGLAALIAKVRDLRYVDSIIKDSKKCFSKVGYDQGVDILRYLRDYARGKAGIWVNYEEGFNHVLTGLVSNELGKSGAWQEAPSHQIRGQKVVFIADYNGAAMAPDVAYTLRNGSSVVIQGANPLVDSPYAIRAHFAVFPDVGHGADVATLAHVTLSHILTPRGKQESIDFGRGDIQIHAGEHGLETLSPKNMEINFMPSEINGTYSFTSHVHPDGWGKPIETFHMLLSGTALEDRNALFKDLERESSGLVSVVKTKPLPKVIFELCFLGLDKPHIKAMIDFIALELKGHRL
jgi:hypothetical protein